MICVTFIRSEDTYTKTKADAVNSSIFALLERLRAYCHPRRSHCGPAKLPSRRWSKLSVEELERRLAPATLASGAALHYTDVDNDLVTVQFSSSLLTVNNDSSVFTFNNAFAASGPQQLEEINLLPLGTAANGLSISVTAAPTTAGGDGFVNVGFINAQYNLGTVTVHGDLGRINAGNSVTPTTGLTALTVHSLGVFGATTQAAGGNLQTNIYGKLGALNVATDIDGAYVNVLGGAAGSIGAVSVGGSVIGGASTGSGSIQSTGTIGPVTIGGDLVGGNGGDSGYVSSGAAMGPVTVGGDIQGGGASNSGIVVATTSLASIAVGGSVTGGAANDSGYVGADTTLGQVTITGSVVGAAGSASGVIFGGASIAGVKIGGALVGGSGSSTGGIEASTSSPGSLGPVAIGGNVQGGTGEFSGYIDCHGAIASITIGGSLLGAGTQSNSGNIQSSGNMGPVTIAGDVAGAGGAESGAVDSGGTLGAVTVGGDLIGGAGANSGEIDSPSAAIGMVAIHGYVAGGVARTLASSLPARRWPAPASGERWSAAAAITAAKSNRTGTWAQ